jgi:hypothetical protein
MRFQWLILLAGCHISPAQRDFRALDWIDIEATTIYTCGIHGDDDSLQCWGTAPEEEPSYEFDPPKGSFTDVTGGNNSACALDTSGGVTCWGDDTYMPLDSPTGSFESIDCDFTFCCGIREEGGVACWGGSAEDAAVLATIDLNYTGSFAQVAVGDKGCGLKENGGVECWKSTLEDEDYYLPFEGKYSYIDAYRDMVCAIVEGTGAIECWQTNQQAELTDSSYPSGDGWTGLAVNDDSVCAIDGSGLLSCVGTVGEDEDEEGEAGPNDIAFQQIDGGSQYTCGITTGGAAHCWGGDENGRLHP